MGSAACNPGYNRLDAGTRRRRLPADGVARVSLRKPRKSPLNRLRAPFTLRGDCVSVILGNGQAGRKNGKGGKLPLPKTGGEIGHRITCAVLYLAICGAVCLLRVPNHQRTHVVVKYRTVPTTILVKSNASVAVMPCTLPSSI